MATQISGNDVLVYSIQQNSKQLHIKSALFQYSAASKKTRALSPRGRGGVVLGISSDGDDRMEPKVKTQKKSLGLPTKPQKIPGPKINPQKIPCRFGGP